MSMPFYVSPEQAMKDKADYARKGIARGRSVVVIAFDGGILFVAPNPSRALHKISEIYDRIAFAAAGKYNEFENLRSAGVRYADVNGYMYDRSDVTARGLANFYAQNLGTIFTETPKPFEVELVVAEVGDAPADDQIYRITFDGSVLDEHGYIAMGGQAEQVTSTLRDRYSDGMPLADALSVALDALGSSNGDRHTFTAAELEVAVLDRGREGRKFRRLVGRRLEGLLPAEESATPAGEESAASEDSTGEAGSTDAASESAAEADQDEADRQAAAEDENLDLPEPGDNGGDGGGDDTSGGS